MNELICAASDSFWQTIFRSQDTAAIFCTNSMIVLCVAIPIIAASWVKVARHRDDAALKQSMIERGMSVEEIERALKAKSSDK